MSLQDPTRKMSKSEHDNGDKGCIYLLDDINIARKKIMSAVTDSVGKIQLDKENQPGIYNLIEIAAALENKSLEKIAENFKDAGYGELKKYVADVVCNELEKIQGRYNEIISSGKIDEILKDGAMKASSIARKTLAKVERKIGLEIR